MSIRAPHVCVLVLLLTAPAMAHAQLGGLLKKEARRLGTAAVHRGKRGGRGVGS
jgi:hypothetical protein